MSAIHSVMLAGKAASPAAVTYTDSTFTNSSASSYTFTGRSIGTASADRKVVVGIASGFLGGVTVSSVTVGGNSASLVKQTTSGGAGLTVELWQVVVTSGTTADVVVTLSGTVDRCGIGLWAVTGAASAASATAGATGSPYQGTITIPASGVCIGVAADQNAGGSFTWTNLTEKYDANIGSATVHTGASDAFATQQTSRVITAAPASSGNYAASFAAWGPA